MLLDRLKLFEHLRQLGVTLETTSKDDSASAQLEEISRLWTKIFRVDGMNREQNFQLQHNRVLDAQDLCASMLSRLSATLKVCETQDERDQMSMQEETVALGEAITFLEQRAEQVESLTGNTMKDAATLIERLSRKLEESQVQRKRFQAERAILDRKFTDSLADIEVAKVENQGLSRQLVATAKEGKGTLEALQQSKQANASLELTIRSLQQELEERASGMKDADVDLQQARLEVQAERRRWEQRMEEAERQRTKKLEEAERARSTEQSRERQKLEEAERERIKEQRQLRADKEAAEAKNAELQARAKALSEQVEAMEKYQGRWEGQRTAVEKERQEMQKTIDKLKYELMGALKKARACEEDADQSRVAMALEVQEQMRKEQAMKDRVAQLQQDLADEKLVMESTIRALEQRRGAKESNEAEKDSLFAARMNRLKEELADERKSHYEEVQGLNKARQSLEELVSEYRQRIDDLHQKVTALEADRLTSPPKASPPRVSDSPSRAIPSSPPPDPNRFRSPLLSDPNRFTSPARATSPRMVTHAPTHGARSSPPPVAAATPSRSPAHPLPHPPSQHQTPSSRGGPYQPPAYFSPAVRTALPSTPYSTPQRQIGTPETAHNNEGGWRGRLRHAAVEDDDDEVAA